jgi:hypothetical protein
MMARGLTPKARKGILLMSGAVLFVLVCAIVAQVPPPSGAMSLGAPGKNVADGNCYCHTNDKTGKEHDPDVVLLALELPDEIPASGTAEFNVTISYPPATTSWRYGFGASISSADGKSLSGASLSSPQGTASENNTRLTHNEPLESSTFVVSLTAPSKPQRIKLTIMGNAVDHDGTERGDHWNYVTKNIDILKSREIYINASIRNKGEVEAKDINVTLFIDGEPMETQNIGSISAGKVQNITFKWDATKYKAGDYKIEVVLDSNSTVLELNEGNNKLVKTVTLSDISGTGGPKFDWTTAVYWILGLVIVALVVGLAYKHYG